MSGSFRNGFGVARASARDICMELAEQCDTRTDDECKRGVAPKECVRRLWQVADKIGGLKAPSREARSGVPITKKEEIA